MTYAPLVRRPALAPTGVSTNRKQLAPSPSRGWTAEREADRVADIVAGTGPAPRGDRSSVTPSGAVAEEVRAAVNSPARPVPQVLRREFESATGRSLGDVKLHVEPPAASVASSLHARAFAFDRHIVFGPRQFEPESRRGKWLLAHELTHVTQPRTGAPVLHRAPIDQVSTTCDKQPVTRGFVADMLHLAQVWAARAMFHLHDLQKLPEAQRRTLWASSVAATWFGAYDTARFERLTDLIGELALALRDQKLAITCTERGDSWASANPGIAKLKLRGLWMREAKQELSTPHATPPASYGSITIPRQDELVQSIVHEVGHTIGIFLAGEGKLYGTAKSKQLAVDNPDRALKNADNFGYFVLEFK